MLHINNSVKLSFPQLLLIILFLIMLVCVYNKGYVTKYYYTAEKYELMRKKYKSALVKCAEKIDESQQLIEAQNAIIIEMQQHQPTDVQNIGTTTSSHSGALTGARFMSSKDPEVMHQHTQVLAPHLPTNSGMPPENFTTPNTQIKDALSTPIDQLLNNSATQQQMAHTATGSMQNQQQQFDTFWSGSSIMPSNAGGGMTLL